MCSPRPLGAGSAAYLAIDNTLELLFQDDKKIGK
jgi:hypothetical protein